MTYIVTGTIGPGNRDTGLPRAQPGSLQWSREYKAQKDPRLSDDERRNAAQQAAARAACEFDAAVQAAAERRTVLQGFALVRHDDPAVGCSATRPIGDGLHVCRVADIESLAAHGYTQAYFD